MDKKKKGIPRLLEIAGEKRGLLIGSSIFSAISAILMLLPYIAVYFIMAELLKMLQTLEMLILHKCYTGVLLLL